MKLFLLEAIENKRSGPGYDEMVSAVVRAENEEEAREFAAEGRGSEDQETWLNPEYSTCKPLTQKGEKGMIARDVAWA